VTLSDKAAPSAPARPLVLLPWDDHATTAPGISEVADVLVWSGTGPLPDGVAEVDLFVPQYMGPPSSLAVMGAMPRLSVVQTLTAGVDNVWEHLPEGVLLCNARGVHDASTAELVVGLIIAKLRRIDDFARAQQAGEWLADRYQALADLHVLIVGYGSVGEALERRLLPFEVEVTKVARSARDGVHAFDELPALLPTADVVVLLCPLTEQTRGMVDAAFLAQLKDGALLVNAARGPVVVTDDLVAALATRRIQAAVDVTDPEPLPADHPLWRAPGVLISPHVGGNTSAFLPRARRLVEAQVRRFAAGAAIENVMTRP
jgi:phosphoglycerate dehydrogenase-like enzyme